MSFTHALSSKHHFLLRQTHQPSKPYSEFLHSMMVPIATRFRQTRSHGIRCGAIDNFPIKLYICFYDVLVPSLDLCESLSLSLSLSRPSLPLLYPSLYLSLFFSGKRKREKEKAELQFEHKCSWEVMCIPLCLLAPRLYKLL